MISLARAFVIVFLTIEGHVQVYLKSTYPGDSHNNCLDIIGLEPPPGSLLDRDAFNITVHFSAPAKYKTKLLPAYLTTSYIDHTPRIKPVSIDYEGTSKEFLTLSFFASNITRQDLKLVSIV